MDWKENRPNGKNYKKKVQKYQARLLFIGPRNLRLFSKNAEDVCIGNVHFYDLHNTQDNFSLQLNNRLIPTRIDISTRYCVSYIIS